MTLVEKLVVTLLDYTKTLPANKREKYTKAFHKFNSLYQSQKIKYTDISTTFVDLIRLKDIKFRS